MGKVLDYTLYKKWGIMFIYVYIQHAASFRDMLILEHHVYLIRKNIIYTGN